MPYLIKDAFRKIGVEPSKKVHAEIYISELLSAMRFQLGLLRIGKAEEIREKILTICEENNIDVPQECRIIK